MGANIKLLFVIFFVPGMLLSIGYELPLLIINTNGNTIQYSTKITANITIIDNGPGILNYETDIPKYTGLIGISIRGNYSASLPQQPYSIETRTNTGSSLDTNLLGMPKENDWVLLANYNDKSFLRNALSLKLFDEMNHYAPRYKLCEVIIDNDYRGIYLFCEKIKQDNDRVNIDKLGPTENSGVNLTGGYIWKNDFGSGWTSPYNPIGHPNRYINYVYEYPKLTNITLQQKNYIQSFVSQAEGVLYGNNFTDPINGYKKYLSTQSFYDYFIVNTLSRNIDGFKKSVYFHKEKNDAITGAIGKIKMGPVWDFDWAWKNLTQCHVNDPNGSGWPHKVNDCGSTADNSSFGWYVRLLQDTTFANALHCRWNQLRLTIIDTAYIFNWIDSNVIALQNPQARHFNRWQNLGMPTGAPENDTAATTYSGEITKLKNMITKRIAWLDNNMYGNALNCGTTTVSENQNTTSILAFPNPCSEYLHIETTNNTDVIAIDIIDISGRKTSTTFEKSDKVYIFNVKDLAEGIYFARIKNNNNITHTEKIIVNH